MEIIVLLLSDETTELFMKYLILGSGSFAGQCYSATFYPEVNRFTESIVVAQHCSYVAMAS